MGMSIEKSSEAFIAAINAEFDRHASQEDYESLDSRVDDLAEKVSDMEDEMINEDRVDDLIAEAKSNLENYIDEKVEKLQVGGGLGGCTELKDLVDRVTALETQNVQLIRLLCNQEERAAIIRELTTTLSPVPSVEGVNV